MEVSSGGELFSKLCDEHDNPTPLTEDATRRFMRQLLAGVTHCHARGVAHLDLKLENVLLSSDDAIKIIDFGLSHQYAPTSTATPQADWDRSVPLRAVCGSKSYAAPEVLAGTGYDGFEADVWSLGVCAFALLSGFFPLDEAGGGDWRFDRLRRAQPLGRSTVGTIFSWYQRDAGHLSGEVIELLDGMLTINPAHRMTMQQAARRSATTRPAPSTRVYKRLFTSPRVRADTARLALPRRSTTTSLTHLGIGRSFPLTSRPSPRRSCRASCARRRSATMHPACGRDP